MLFLSLLLAFLPSIIWLLLYLREDVHPEPNRMVLKVFAAGMLVTIPTLVVEGFLNCAIIGCSIPGTNGVPPTTFPTLLPTLSEHLRKILYLFLGIALVEEYLKYLAVRWTVLRNPEFDEPIDALLYLVIAALGFAAVENAFTVASGEVQAVGLIGPQGVLAILGARSVSATLLHTLASATVGYALARSFFSRRPKKLLLSLGVLLAALIHGSYNGFISGDLTLSRSSGAPADGRFLGNVALLLLVTGSVILAMLRNLRTMSAQHRWQNEGENAQEVDLLPNG